MIIKKIAIESFGRLRSREIPLSPGINVLYGPNESGKTTIHTFVKSMLFGLTRMRGRASRNDAYSRYEPWDSSGTYGGKLWFQCEDRSFRLTRSFRKGEEEQELICEDDGEVLDIQSGDLKALLGNISEAVYENTVSIAQLKSATSQGLVRELQNYMASYEGSGDAAVDLNRTMQALKMWRKGCMEQVQDRQEELEKEEERLLSSMDYLRQELDQQTARRDQLLEQATVSGVKQALTHPEDLEEGELYDERIADYEKRRTLCRVLEAVLLAGCLAGAVFAGLPWAALLLAAGIAGETGLILMGRNLSRSLSRYKKAKIRRMQKQEKLLWNLDQLNETVEEKETTLENLRKDYEECEALAAQPQPQQTDIEGLNLAMETIRRISGNMQRRLGDSLRSRTSQILAEITEGKYTQVFLDEELNMTVNTSDRSVPVERLSRGTVEQIYFAFRMAVSDMLCQEELPIVLDDVFAMYDEERLGAVLRWLQESGRQVIISTCHTREAELMDKLGILYFQCDL